MEIYKQMYLHLFNTVTDAIEQLQNSVMDDKESRILAGLIAAQQECEEMYIENE